MKVLYVGVGDPIVSRSGMDRVIREHISELGLAQGLSVDAVVVAPGDSIGGCEASFKWGCADVRVFVGDLPSEHRSVTRVLGKIKLVFCKHVPVLAYAFRSRKARKLIKYLINSKLYDLIVVDHFYAFANLNLIDFLRFRGKKVYISHDSMVGLLSGVEACYSSFFRKIYFSFEIFRVNIVEYLLFTLTSLVIHISSYECDMAKKRGGAHRSLLPLLPVEIASELDQGGRNRFGQTVLFVGSISYFPNLEAIDWLVEFLSPALARIDPGIKIGLIGAGTDSVALSSNMVAYGFVSDEDVKYMLRHCLCTISPVVYGHGIKVKVLESIAAGCPVLATSESLRGLETFGIESMVDIGDPDLTALNVKHLADATVGLNDLRDGILSKWDAFCKVRRGMLVQVLRNA